MSDRPDWLRDGWEIAEDGSVSGPVWPFERLSGGQCDAIRIRRMTGADLRYVDSLPESKRATADATLSLIGKLTGLHAEELDRMDAGDIGYIGQVVEVFTSGGHATGGRI